MTAGSARTTARPATADPMGRAPISARKAAPVAPVTTTDPADRGPSSGRTGRDPTTDRVDRDPTANKVAGRGAMVAPMAMDLGRSNGMTVLEVRDGPAAMDRDRFSARTDHEAMADPAIMGLVPTCGKRGRDRRVVRVAMDHGRSSGKTGRPATVDRMALVPGVLLMAGTVARGHLAPSNDSMTTGGMVLPVAGKAIVAPDRTADRPPLDRSSPGAR